MAESYHRGWKTLWEKEKLLVMSNFSFSHSIFKRLVSQGRQMVSLCGNGLKCTLFQITPSKGIENIQMTVCCSMLDLKASRCPSDNLTIVQEVCLPHSVIHTLQQHWKSRLFKIILEKEKILVTNIFSFSHNVFYFFSTSSAVSAIFNLSYKCFQSRSD